MLAIVELVIVTAIIVEVLTVVALCLVSVCLPLVKCQIVSRLQWYCNKIREVKLAARSTVGADFIDQLELVVMTLLQARKHNHMILSGIHDNPS